jgi:hypothetical protein
MGTIISLTKQRLQKCFIAIGVSDGGSGSDVCLDSTPSGVRSAIAANSVNEYINCNDNAIAINVAPSNASVFYGAKLFIVATAKRTPVASIDCVNATSASNASAFNEVETFLNFAA